MTQHFIRDGRSETYACGANAVGRRNTRLDTNPALTTCTPCRVELRQIITGKLGYGRGWHFQGLAARKRAAQTTPSQED